jgi:hypothetical protein
VVSFGFMLLYLIAGARFELMHTRPFLSCSLDCFLRTEIGLGSSGEGSEQPTLWLGVMPDTLPPL